MDGPEHALRAHASSWGQDSGAPGGRAPPHLHTRTQGSTGAEAPSASTLPSTQLQHLPAHNRHLGNKH